MSKNRSAESPPDLREIETTSREFHQLAESVEKKLVAFDEWLKALPAKTEVSVWHQGNADEPSFGIDIKRYKNAWQLLYSKPDSEIEDAFEMKPVEGAPLDDKCRVIPMLPALLTEFYNKQRVAVDRLKVATNIFSQLPDFKGGR